MAAAGVKVFAYLFTDPDAVVIEGLLSPSAAPGSIGGTHLALLFRNGTSVTST